MNVEYPTNHFISSVRFSFGDSESFKRISVKNINNPVLLDENERPTSGGLYDMALGPYTKRDRCATCRLNHLHCPGHFGHIELSVPVFNPLLFAQLVKIYRSMCINCNRLRHNDNMIAIWMAKLRLLEHGLVFAAKDVDLVFSQFMSSDIAQSTENDLDCASALIRYLEAYVKEQIEKNRENTANVHSLLVQKYKREVIDETIFGKVPPLVCEYCRDYNPPLYVPGGGLNRLFELPRPLKYQNAKITFGSSSTAKRPLISDDYQQEQKYGEKNHEENQDHMQEDEMRMRTSKILTPLQVMERMRKMWKKHASFFSLCFDLKDTDEGYRMFFIEIIPVPPTRFRPPSIINGMIYENPQNTYLTSILNASQKVEAAFMGDTENGAAEKSSKNSKEIPASKNLNESRIDGNIEGVPTKRIKEDNLAQIINNWMELQEQVNLFYDSSRMVFRGGKQAPPGIKQILEKKTGIFRKHMMGKRVNFSARSVISPDIAIETNEIGLPLIFASRLTYPEPVTPHNILRLRQAVINGPVNHPGATHIQHEDGTLSNLSLLSIEARTALANSLMVTSTTNGSISQTTAVNKRVWRHVRDGDILLLNRQPTLHRPSIMAHRCRVLPGEKTIRMHYANCNTYNADFDGDEMNVHVPQTELGRAEGYLIAMADSQYTVPTDGSPLRGLIQDHIAAAVRLTLRDTLLDRERVMDLLAAAALPFPPALLLPCVLRPRPKWSGKQVISILLNSLLDTAPSINLTARAKIPARLLGKEAGEEESTIRVLDSYLCTGIIDKAQIGNASHGLVHAIYELYGGIPCGKLLSALSRLLTVFLQLDGFTCGIGDLVLRSEIDESRDNVIKSALEQKPEEKMLSNTSILDDTFLRELDGVMKGAMNNLTSTIIDMALPEGLLQRFPANNMTLMTMSGAKGSLVNMSQISGALGQQELEGRRVPLMLSLRTLPCFESRDLGARPGGYISQRFLSGILLPEFYFHCMAGREGLIDTAVKTARSGYLQRCIIKNLESVRTHYDGSVRDIDGSVIQFLYGEDGIDVTRSISLEKFPFLSENTSALVSRLDPGTALQSLDCRTVTRRKFKDSPMPIISRAWPWTTLGAVSDRFSTSLDAFFRKKQSEQKTSVYQQSELCTNSKHSEIQKTEDQFRVLMWMRYMRALVEPGEMVGVLAAQSIGEPSTQMTLNTFHFAGLGAKNVTLGIPRLREIVMMASKQIKTPTMSVPFRDYVSESVARRLVAQITRRTLHCITQSLSITEGIERKKIVYRISLTLLPIQKLQSNEYCITGSEVKKAITDSLIPLLREYITKQSQKQKSKDRLAIVSHVDQDFRVKRANMNGELSEALKQDELSDAEDKTVVEKDSEDRDFNYSSSSSEEDDEEEEEDREEDKTTLTTKTIDYSDPETEAENETETSRTELSVTTGSTISRLVKQHKSIPLSASSSDTDSFHYDAALGVCTFTLVYSTPCPKLFLLPVVEKLLTRIVVREIPSIGRCYFSEEDQKTKMLFTEGVNLFGLAAADPAGILDINQLYSNDISAILAIFGVEAARSVIVKEIAAVFDVYGISVDKRHLFLIADYMTFEGAYRPMNRIGIATSTSPFLKLTFESTFKYLKFASLFGEKDLLHGPSSRLAMGQVTDIGTSSFDIVQPVI